MAAIRFCAFGIVAAWGSIVASAEPERATLRESPRPGSTTRVTVGLSAQGLYQPEGAPTAAEPAKGEEKSKGLSLKVETRLEYVERVLAVDVEGRPNLALRRATRAGAAINGDVRPRSSALRPEVATLLAQVTRKGVEISSTGGPLTRSELELVDGPGDPLALSGLLPPGSVALESRWKASDAAVRSLSGYDALSGNTVEAQLVGLDADSATVRLNGEARGEVLGGEGTMALNGSYTFDRKSNLMSRMTLERAETRRPGPVEAGLDIRGTLELTRGPGESTPSLSDAAVAALNAELDAERPDPSKRRERLLLLLKSADGRFTLRHDRDWHTYWDDNRLTVLKRLGPDGELIGQCNLAVGPKAGRGRHQDLGQFRDDVRKGLGDRFVAFLGSGEVDGDPAGHFRYKIGAQGRQGELGVVWYYYLIASPEGEQVLATFTLASTALPAFGAEDERLVGAFRWEPTAEAASA